jgi:hypothetical protein
MKRLFAFLVVLVVAAVPVYISLRPPDLGVSKKDPFGTFDKIDAWLREEKIESSKIDWEDSPFEGVLEQPDGVAVTRYKDAERCRQHNMDFSVYLARGANGSLHALAAQFWSGQENDGGSRSRPQTFASLLWKQVTGAEPKFVQDSQGQGMFFKLYRAAKIEKATHLGYWKKEYLSALEAKTIVDLVMMWRP